MTKQEMELIAMIKNIDEEQMKKALESFDRKMADTDPWAFREFTGHWPTKADK